jgi:hypothetical protein
MISRLIVLGDLFKALDIARTLEPSRPISITVARSSGFNWALFHFEWNWV